MTKRALSIALFLLFASAGFVYTVFYLPSGNKLPKELDINGVYWRVSEVNKIGTPQTPLAGYTDCARKHIYISRESDRKATSIMHEVSHAVVCTDASEGFTVNNMYYNSKTNDGHEGIYAWSDVWSEILQRNPDLANYIVKQEDK